MKEKGFTLIELILAIAIVGALAGLTVAGFKSIQKTQELTHTKGIIVESLRRAQVQSVGGIQDGPWGVQVNTGSITLFQGTSYASRNTTYDEVLPFPRTVVVSGTSEIVFTKLTGTPSAPATINLSSTQGSGVVTVSTTGVIVQ